MMYFFSKLRCGLSEFVFWKIRLHLQQIENRNDQDRLLGCLSYNPCTVYNQLLLVMKAITMDF